MTGVQTCALPICFPVTITEGDKFTIDQLNLSKKVYDMLNRIAVSGGTYQDWVETVYTSSWNMHTETPMYEGGMSSEIEFQEVVSNSATSDEPLGTLAGRGINTSKKGGKLHIKVVEPCYIMGIVSITPRVELKDAQLNKCLKQKKMVKLIVLLLYKKII